MLKVGRELSFSDTLSHDTVQPLIGTYTGRNPMLHMNNQRKPTHGPEVQLNLRPPSAAFALSK